MVYYVFGDSHGNELLNLDLPDIYHCSQPSITMHRIGRDNSVVGCNEYDMTEDTIVISCYGEVDCRCHIKRQELAGRDVDEVIETLVEKYIATLSRVFRRCKKVLVFGVIPTCRKTDYDAHVNAAQAFPFVGTDKERVAYTDKVNDRLERYCKLHENLMYVYPYDFCRMEDGTLNYEVSDLNVHISLDNNKPLIHKLAELCKQIISDKPFIYKNNIIFQIHNNVKTQRIDVNTSVQSFEYYDTPSNRQMKRFFLFETPCHGAFSHWIYESAVFLAHYIELLKEYPDLRLLVRSTPARKYKKQIFKAFGIKDWCIHWINSDIKDDDSEIIYANLPQPNQCIVSPVQCMTTEYLPRLDDFYRLSKKYVKFVEQQMKEECVEGNDIIFYPRGRSDLCTHRLPNYDMAYSILKDKQYLKYDNSAVENICEQFAMISKSKELFIDYGSAFWVNVMFCTNATIYITDENDNMAWQYERFQAFHVLLAMIKRRNNTIVNLHFPRNY